MIGIAFNFILNSSWVILHNDGVSQSEELIKRQQEQITLAIIGALVPVVLLFAFTFFFLYRRKRESDFRNKELELKVSIAQMELKALRSQVNPHFIFNCLNSIQHYIHQSNNDLAETYLVKFSRLIRRVLEHSCDPFISLEDDLKTLELYIQLEGMRMNNSFSYHIEMDPELNPELTFVPPMLLQPLVENAIWHGLNNRDQGGVIRIAFKKGEEHLNCRITDNGLKGDYISNQKGRSFGMELIRDRITLLNQNETAEAILKMNPLTDDTGNQSGMQVDLVIPYEKES